LAARSGWQTRRAEDAAGQARSRTFALACPELRLHKAASEHSQDSDFVFASREGTPLEHRNIVTRGLDKATEQVGIGEYVKDKRGRRRWRSGIRWHDLRHTFCTRLLEQGQGLPILAALMGWSAATTVRMAKRYGHISGDVLSAAVAVLDPPKANRV